MDKIFTFFAYLGLILGYVILGVWVWLEIPDTNAYSGTGCTFTGYSALTTPFAGQPRWNRVSCYIDGSIVNFGYAGTVGGGVTTTALTMNDFTSEKFGSLGPASFTGCTLTSNNGNCSTYTIYNVGTGAMFRKGDKGDKGDIGPRGNTGADSTIPGAAGSQGNDGLNAFELAQVVEGYSGDVYTWLDSLRGATGATGSIMIDLTQTGNLVLQNNINLSQTGSEYGTGEKLPLVYTDFQGNYFIDRDNALNLFLYLIFGLIFVYTFIKSFFYSYKVGESVFNKK